jgi:hypothetical protein
MDVCALDGEPGADRSIVACKGLITAVNECARIRWKTSELSPPEEPLKHVGGHGVARFDFHRIVPGVPEQISFEESVNHAAILRSDRKFVNPWAV